MATEFCSVGSMRVPIIDDSNWQEEWVQAPKHPTRGDHFAKGAVPRDLKVDPYPKGSPADPSSIKTFSQADLDAAIAEADAKKTFPFYYVWFDALDQNSIGYCWVFSGGACTMISREKTNAKRVKLNPFSTGSVIKNGRDEGGWCGLAYNKGYSTIGCAPEGTGPGEWPWKDLNYRSRYTAEMQAVMKRYTVTEGYYDLNKEVYDQTLTLAQLYTCLILGFPCAVDFNWWSHSVCAVKVVRIEAGSYGIMILNSWTKTWGENGFSVLRGSQAVPDNAVAYLTPMAA